MSEVAWYSRAAKGDSSHAMFNLGLLHQQPEEQYSVSSAEYGYRRAANTGPHRSYEQASRAAGRTRNITEAQNWYRRPTRQPLDGAPGAGPAAT